MKQVSHNSSLILFKKILSSLNKKSKIKLLITFVVCVFATFLEILSLLILQKSLDSIINKTDSLSTINSPFFFTILFVIILSLSTIANSYSVFKIGRTVAYIGSNWSKRCFEKIFSKDLIYGHSKRSDKMINLMKKRKFRVCRTRDGEQYVFEVDDPPEARTWASKFLTFFYFFFDKK